VRVPVAGILQLLEEA